MKWWTIICVIVTCLAFNNSLYAAGNDTSEIINVKSISYTIEGGESVTFQFSSPLIAKIFTMSGEKPRLVIDLPGAVYKGGKVAVPAGAELAGNLRIGYHTAPVVKTRVVLDLNPDKKVTFKRDREGETLVVSLHGPGKKGDAAPAAVQEQAAATPAVSTPIPEKKESVADKKETVAQPAVAEKAIEAPVTAASEETAAASKKIPLVVVPAAAPAPAEEPKEKTKVIAEKPLEQNPVPPVFAVKKDPVKSKKKVPEAKSAELLEVRFDNSSEKGEMILFHLNDFFPPRVTAIETDNPGVVCEFSSMKVAPQVEETIFANGKFVERIRTEKQADIDKVKVFLDLAPNYDYDLQQVFFKTDNLFVLIVNELVGEKKSETAAQ